jgi:hypothetical protein
MVGVWPFGVPCIIAYLLWRSRVPLLEIRRRESIMGHVFKGREGGAFKIRTWGKVATTLTLLMAIVLLGLGVCKESFEFTFKGAAGLVLAPEDRTAAYSVVTLGLQIPASVDNPEGERGARI